MKLLTLIALSALALPVMPAAASECPAVLQHEMPKLRSGQRRSVPDLQGKALVVVNTASHCGFTRNSRASRRSISATRATAEVLGVPSDDFFQESDDEARQPRCAT